MSQLSKLKDDFSKKYLEYYEISDNYSCGITLASNINPRLVTLKNEMESIWEDIKQLDPTAPELTLGI